MALGWIMILFVGMSVFSVLGLMLMYLFRQKTVKKVLFYVMAVWGLAIAWISAQSLPTNFVYSRMIALGIGAFSVVGMIMSIVAKGKKAENIAYFLVTLSVIAGILNMFFM